jgi:hypothetical protein
MQDLKNNIGVVQSLAPAARDADANGTGVDLQGFESATVVIDMGAEGITLSSTNKIEIELEHSDDNSTFTDVTSSADVIGATPDSSGVIATFDDPAEAPAIASVGYIGGKRYIRAVANFSGTHGTATPMSVSVIKGHARKNPVS